MSQRIESVQQYFETLDQRFVRDAAKGVEAVFQFDISGDAGGTWHVVVKDGEMAVHAGSHDKPSAVVHAKDADYVKIANGDINGLRAVMTRKMRISGNLVMARKMQHMFPTGNI
ncbi:MAG: SCP2 sterol-binding domain-containing protein [Myxococcales bacterium]|nr:SCP2 sterol-binding domain-containing protein [Myxococcales bacterium]MCB9666385.1 SCP2 sterol-binding domain-containing protein [Alphaproteobacteria bacterium]